MTLKELLSRHEFKEIAANLIEIDKEHVPSNLYAFKEAFDYLRRMTPTDAAGEEIKVTIEVEKDDEGKEIKRYCDAFGCSGDFWERNLDKEVVIEDGIPKEQALAQILWEITFWGFTPETEGFPGHTLRNEYERKAAMLSYKQFCNYAPVKRKKHPDELDLRCALPQEGWDEYDRRKEHRNRSKRMRDARQERSIKRLERMGKVQNAIDRVMAAKPMSISGWKPLETASLKYLFGTSLIRELDFYSRTPTVSGRVEYIADNISEYFNDDTSKFTDAALLIESPEKYPLTGEDMDVLLKATKPLIGHCKRSIILSGTKPVINVSDEDPKASRKNDFDIHLLLILSR